MLMVAQVAPLGDLRSHGETAITVDRIEVLGRAMESVRGEAKVISVGLLPSHDEGLG